MLLLLLIVKEHEVSLTTPSNDSSPRYNDCNDGRSKTIMFSSLYDTI